MCIDGLEDRCGLFQPAVIWTAQVFMWSARIPKSLVKFYGFILASLDHISLCYNGLYLFLFVIK